MGIYVEIPIRAALAEVWRLTQTPAEHVRWDLRFTDIDYLPRADESEPQRFHYGTRLGFGLAIRGRGETIGQRNGDGGERASSLKFWSDDSKSLIREGAGYWQYIPTPDGVKFLTSYDYRVRFGVLGKLFDVLVFRPLMGWATAWSFDRLRLWIEKGIDPALSMQRSLMHALARAAVAFVWFYQGLVPKLLGPHADELAMFDAAGVSAGSAPAAVQIAGWCEVVLGLAMLIFFRRRWHFLLTIFLMLGATLGVAICSPEKLGAAFNPVGLNMLMIALAGVGYLASRDLPSARRCLRRRPRGER